MKFTKFIVIILSILLLQCTSMKENNNGSKINKTPGSWTKVDSLNKKGLYKSAWEEVDKIYAFAAEKGDMVEQIKATFHQLHYSQRIEEDSEIKGIKSLTEKIEKAEEPLKSILHSICAEQYWNYYQNKRYLILQRTETGEENDDIKRWTARNFIDKVNHHYLNSFQNIESLKEVKLSKIDREFFEGKHNLYFKNRVSLYDFLMQRALRFYSNAEAGVTRPNDFFRLDNEDYLQDLWKFSAQNIAHADDTSFDFLALKLYRDLLVYYQSVNAEDPLLVTDLERINWLYNKSSSNRKMALKNDALDAVIQKSFKSDVIGEYRHAKIAILKEEAMKYDPLSGDDANRLALKEVIKQCKNVIAEYPDTRASDQCRSMIAEIKYEKLSITTEDIVLPNKSSLARVEYRNVDKLYCRIIETKWLSNQDYRDYEEQFRTLFSKKSLVSWEVDLKSSDDHHKHSTELIIPAVPTGHYTVLISTDSEFTVDKTIAAKATFWSSHIAVDQRNDMGEKSFKLTNRLTGDPLKNAKIDQYQLKGGRRDNIWNLKESYLSDRDGAFSTVNFEGYGNYYLDIRWNGEEIKVPMYHNGYYNRAREKAEAHIFIDRGIYRPGQTIHFKALVLDRFKHDVDLAKDFNLEVTFRDANYQEVAVQNLKTNRFGTVNGSFTIPNSGLTGSMTLQTSYGSKSFRVEEYKRPKFEVQIDPLKGAYKLGEKVKVEGQAVAFSGANLQDAEVKYTVYRKPIIRYFHWWYWCFIPPYAQSENVKIVDGVLQTDAQGKYSFEFDAIDGGDGNAQWLNYYQYAVEVVVTDINGETQVANQNIPVGKKALKLNVDIGEYYNTAKALKHTINSTNLGGEDVDAQGSLILYKLQGPKEVKVDRYWSITDQLNYDQDELNNKIPWMAYPGQSDKSKWKRDKVTEITFDTKSSREIPSSFLKKMKDGEYVVVIKAKDVYGTDVENEHYVKAYSPGNIKPVSYTDFEVIDVNSTYKPGEELKLVLSTSLEDIKLFIEVEHRDAIVKMETMYLTKGKKIFTLPVKKEYQGGFSLHISGYKNNRFFAVTKSINVPRIDNQLEVTLETFRDKMLPGSEEEWKVKVKAANGDQGIAEVLLNMYDASLDQFVTNDRSFTPFYNHYPKLSWRSKLGNVKYGETYQKHFKGIHVRGRNYPELNYYVFHGDYNSYRYYSNNSFKARSSESVVGVQSAPAGAPDMVLDEVQVLESGDNNSDNAQPPRDDNNNLNETNDAKKSEMVLSPRTNFNETAFFYPDLLTDKEGNLIFSFTIPESLTKWKFQALAHTEKLQYGLLEKEMVTQKDLMVVPNLPRFFREGDKINIGTKIVNLSEQALNGKAKIQLFDAFTMMDITSKIIQGSAEIEFALDAKGQDLASWELNVIEDVQAVTWRISAISDTHADAEENSLPVLTNRSLVTETMPFAMTNKKELNLSFDKYKNNNSTTMSPHSLTLEYTGNPVWYAVQAMPYMLEYPHDCAEQIFTRYYANSLSSHIMEKKPQIKKVIDNWMKFSPESFLSNLEKNQELKSIVLEESPWVMQSKNETERKKRIALLLDLNKMSNEKARAFQQLKEAQDNSGAWSWFKGMRPNLYITQYIVSGFGHMEKLGLVSDRQEDQMVMRGLDYMDREHLKRYREMKRRVTNIEANHTGSFQVQYLYARSFFGDQKFRSDKEAYNYYSGQVKKYWTSYNNYLKGMVALVMYRQGDIATANDIMKSLKETSLYSEEMGMYWKNDTYSWNWYEPSTEKHALMIEAFGDITQDQESVNGLKTWLIMNKRTNDWKTTRATAEACYALLLQGDDWTETNDYEITIGSEKIKSTDQKVVKEPGSGRFKKVWSADDIDKSMADIKITKEKDTPSWGALYFQYFENLDKVQSDKGPLDIDKKISIVTETPNGEVLKSMEDANIKVGDRIRVRLEVSTDRNMSYVHIKDQRAASLEPIDVLSYYRYSGGLGYYQSTRDAATHFFIDNLRKGTYVIEYDMFVAQSGDLSNGYALIECMYAPEFASHSEGVRLKID